MWPVFVRTNLFAQPCHASCAVDGRILIAPPTRNSRPSPALSGATVLSNRLRLPFDYSHIPLFWQRPVFSPTRLLCLSVTYPATGYAENALRVLSSSPVQQRPVFSAPSPRRCDRARAFGRRGSAGSSNGNGTDGGAQTRYRQHHVAPPVLRVTATGAASSPAAECLLSSYVLHTGRFGLKQAVM